MDIATRTSDELRGKRKLLSYISSKEKYGLVGSFVVDDYWEIFNQEKRDAINIFRNIAKTSVHAFIDAYEDVWNFVVDINELDDTFLCESLEKNKTFQGLSYKELQVAVKLLSLSLYSELEKDCLMALNKNILGELAGDLSKKYGFSEEQFQLLMTPSFETFFTKYHFDHLEYTLSKDPSTKEQLRASLIQNFHAKDSKLFELRFADMYFPEDDNLEGILLRHKQALIERSAKKNELISNRDELVAFEKLLRYDNFIDFEYRYNLQACPEYYLRKLLFSACQESGIFTEYSKPLALKDAEFIDGVNALIDARADKYTIKLDSSFDPYNSGTLSDAEKVHGEGSKEEILHYLQEGSPCVVFKESSHKRSPDNSVIIVGYDNGVLIAQDDSGERYALRDTQLAEFKEFCVLRKHNKQWMNDLEKSIQQLIDRKPYLDRTDYERGFRVG